MHQPIVKLRRPTCKLNKSLVAPLCLMLNVPHRSPLCAVDLLWTSLPPQIRAGEERRPRGPCCESQRGVNMQRQQTSMKISDKEQANNVRASNWQLAKCHIKRKKGCATINELFLKRSWTWTAARVAIEHDLTNWLSLYAFMYFYPSAYVSNWDEAYKCWLEQQREWSISYVAATMKRTFSGRLLCFAVNTHFSVWNDSVFGDFNGCAFQQSELVCSLHPTYWMVLLALCCKNDKWLYWALAIYRGFPQYIRCIFNEWPIF